MKWNGSDQEQKAPRAIREISYKHAPHQNLNL